MFGGLLERRDLLERDWMRGTLLMPETASGRVVGNENQALSFSAFWRAVRVLADSVGPMPLEIFEELPGGGRRKAIEHPLYPILHLRPNPWMTKTGLMTTVMGHLVCRGNAFLHLVRTGRGISEIWPLRPDKMRIASTTDTNYLGGMPLEGGFGGTTLRYFYTMPDNSTVEIPQGDLIHLRGMGFDGIRGYSVLTLARESMGLGLAMEEFGARFFSNGSRPSGFLQSPGKMDPEDAKRLKAQFEEGHRGLANAQRIAVLEEGLTWQAVGVAPDDAQFLQSRKYQVEEMARWTGVPPHMLFELARSTNNNIEQQGMEFLNFTLLVWLVTIQEQMGIALLPATGQYSLEFIASGLLRSDVRTRAAVAATRIQWGIWCPDEARAEEGLNPRPDGLGSEYIRPLNMVTTTASDTLSAIGATPLDDVKTPAQVSAEADTGNLVQASLGKRVRHRRLGYDERDRVTDIWEEVLSPEAEPEAVSA